MAARESKRALARAAELLDTDARSARVYLRRVQHLSGPVPYVTIVTAMQRVNTSEVEAVAALAAELACQDRHHGGR